MTFGRVDQLLQVEPVLIGITVASTIISAALLYEKWLKRPMHPITIKDSNFIGEYIEHYCKKTGQEIDKVVLVAYNIDERHIAYRVEDVDMYPEIWLGDNE